MNHLSKPLIDHRIYTIALRKMPEFLDVFNRLAMPLLLDTLGHPLGFYTSLVGPQTNLYTCGATTIWPTTSNAAKHATHTPHFLPIWLHQVTSLRRKKHDSSKQLTCHLGRVARPLRLSTSTRP